MQTHYEKVDCPTFQRLYLGMQKFFVYQCEDKVNVGDIISFFEYDNNRYTSSVIVCQVTYIEDNYEFLPKNTQILSLELIERRDIDFLRIPEDLIIHAVRDWL